MFLCLKHTFYDVVKVATLLHARVHRSACAHVEGPLHTGSVI
ncbi:unnamed protein product, partial [Arabidopsis halleri]